MADTLSAKRRAELVAALKELEAHIPRHFWGDDTAGLVLRLTEILLAALTPSFDGEIIDDNDPRPYTLVHYTPDEGVSIVSRATLDQALEWMVADKYKSNWDHAVHALKHMQMERLVTDIQGVKPLRLLTVEMGDEDGWLVTRTDI